MLHDEHKRNLQHTWWKISCVVGWCPRNANFIDRGHIYIICTSDKLYIKYVTAQRCRTWCWCKNWLLIMTVVDADTIWIHIILVKRIKIEIESIYISIYVIGDGNVQLCCVICLPHLSSIQLRTSLLSDQTQNQCFGWQEGLPLGIENYNELMN